jgi:hypothetical protein
MKLCSQDRLPGTDFIPLVESGVRRPTPSLDLGRTDTMQTHGASHARRSALHGGAGFRTFGPCRSATPPWLGISRQTSSLQG